MTRIEVFVPCPGVLDLEVPHAHPLAGRWPGNAEHAQHRVGVNQEALHAAPVVAAWRATMLEASDGVHGQPEAVSDLLAGVLGDAPGERETPACDGGYCVKGRAFE
jgi:hypothetical protein